MSDPAARPYADHVVDYAQAGWPCIVLPSGHLTVVDPDIYAAAFGFDWRDNAELYVRATVNGQRTFLHRFVMGAGPGEVVDHRNHNPLDNRRINLRVCTTAQNQANKQRPRTNTSGYKGVVWRASRRKWEAAIQPRGASQFLGRFDDPWEAAQAYNAAAVEIYGEYAHLNERIEANA